jgi:hypothetical protein
VGAVGGAGLWVNFQSCYRVQSNLIAHPGDWAKDHLRDLALVYATILFIYEEEDWVAMMIKSRKQQPQMQINKKELMDTKLTTDPL